MANKRKALIRRKTKETAIELELDLDGRGRFEGRCPVPFLEHMLILMAFHGGFDLRIAASGDLEVDDHHLVEDVGLCLGKALAQALGDKKGIGRYGQCVLPMDEALVRVALDISGRPHLRLNLPFRAKKLGEFDAELISEFLQALVNEARITLHIDKLEGRNSHHIVEAAFKALGRALGQAAALDPDAAGSDRSSKGMIE